MLRLLLRIFEERILFNPVAALVSIPYTLIHGKLTIVSKSDLQPIKRTRRRSFKVKTTPPESAAMARTFELILSLKPAGRAP